MKIRILKTALVLIAVLSICSCKGKEGGNSSKSSKGPDLTVANSVEDFSYTLTDDGTGVKITS